MKRWAFVAIMIALSACRADKDDQERAREADAVLISGDAIDCTGELSDATRAVCADVELRAMDRQIAELWSEVEAVTGRPSTLRRRHADWLAERDAGERAWDSGELRTRTPAELRDFHQAYIDALTEELRQARALPATSPISALGGGCIGAALNGCTAPASGYLTGARGQRLAWQRQSGSTELNGVSEGIILFRIDGDLLRPIGWSFEGAGFEAPVMFQDGEHTYVASKGWLAGTGNQNADVLFRLDGQAWTEIEVESWKTALDQALPEGLEVWKGVDYDWPSMMAVSGLWRPDDANCCPTGGEAVMELRVDGTALELVRVTTRPGRD